MNELPKFDYQEIRAIIFEWLSLLEELDASGNVRDDRMSKIAAVANDLKLAADKSSYLGRRFAGQPHRSEPCPIHKGMWSGLPYPGHDCLYGCNLTGWLPSQVERNSGEDELTILRSAHRTCEENMDAALAEMTADRNRLLDEIKQK